MERTLFNERIQKEFEEFRTETLKLSKEEIFESGYEISLKTYLTYHLQNSELLDDETAEKLNQITGNILDELIDCYINNDGEVSYYDISQEIIDDYLTTYFFDEEDEDTE